MLLDTSTNGTRHTPQGRRHTVTRTCCCTVHSDVRRTTGDHDDDGQKIRFRKSAGSDVLICLAICAVFLSSLSDIGKYHNKFVLSVDDSACHSGLFRNL